MDTVQGQRHFSFKGSQKSKAVKNGYDIKEVNTRKPESGNTMKDPIITGKTTEGKPTVFARLFQWKDQEGLPLEIVVNKIMHEGYIVDWLYEVEGALWLGYTEERIMADLREIFHFIYPECYKVLLGKVNHYFIMRQTPNPYTMQALKITKPI